MVSWMIAGEPSPLKRFRMPHRREREIRALGYHPSTPLQNSRLSSATRSSPNGHRRGPGQDTRSAVRCEDTPSRGREWGLDVERDSELSGLRKFMKSRLFKPVHTVL